AGDVTLVYRYSDRDTVDLNLPDQVTGVKRFPQFARVSFWQSTADNTYKALLLKLEKRMSKNYSFLASYTLSKAADIGFTNTFRASRSLTTVTQVDCPRYANVDIRFSKFLRIGRSQRAEFIVQLFNVFDRVNFNTPAGSLTLANDSSGRPLFGQPNSLSPNI